MKGSYFISISVVFEQWASECESKFKTTQLRSFKIKHKGKYLLLTETHLKS